VHQSGFRHPFLASHKQAWRAMAFIEDDNDVVEGMNNDCSWFGRDADHDSDVDGLLAASQY
jgi:hypothetical protein